ncbi:hypothetical protein EDD11_006579 [Mortierella claussenii]|nr:hypothetical protein EDD11_006579 [Mortierella claussenii]
MSSKGIISDVTTEFISDIESQLLKLMEGWMGNRRVDESKVAISIGVLGKLSSGSGLFSAHTLFQLFFVKKVSMNTTRSRGARDA